VESTKSSTPLRPKKGSLNTKAAFMNTGHKQSNSKANFVLVSVASNPMAAIFSGLSSSIDSATMAAEFGFILKIALHISHDAPF
jgi:hypothetical protein